MTLPTENKEPFQEKFYKYSPWLITITGYVLSLGILGGAASTWFIHISTSARTSGKILPITETFSFPNKIILLESYVAPGEFVPSGKPLAKLLTDPEQIDTYELSKKLQKQISNAQGKNDSASETQYRALLEQINMEYTPEVIIASKPGWVTNLAAASQDEIIPSSQPLLSISTSDNLRLECQFNAQNIPSLKEGDETQIFFSKWGKTYLKAQVLKLDMTGIISIPKGKLPIIKINSKQEIPEKTSIILDELEFPSSILVADDEVELHFPVSASNPPSMKIGKTTYVTLPEVSSEPIPGIWKALDVKLILELHNNLPTNIRSIIEDYLKAGKAEIPVNDLWVTTGTTRLFSRLFNK